MFDNQRSTIGVDVGGATVRLSQLEPTAEGGLRIAAAAEASLDPDLDPSSAAYHRAVTQAIGQAKKQARFTGKTAISTLPASSVHYKNIRLPRMPQDELAKAVRYEAQDRLQLGNEPHMVRFLDGGQVRQGEEVRQEVIAMAAPTAFVEAHSNSLAAAGLQLTAIDVAPSALARALAGSRSGAEEGAHLLIDVGRNSTKVLITRDGCIVFFKLIAVGGKHLTQAAAEAWGVDAAEAHNRRSHLQVSPSPNPPLNQSTAQSTDHTPRVQTGSEDLAALDTIMAELGREIALCLRYYGVTFRGQRPAHGELVGGESLQPWLAAMLGRHAGIEVSPVDPLAAFERSDDCAVAPGQGGVWTTCAGLALRSFMEAEEGQSNSGPNANAKPPAAPSKHSRAKLSHGKSTKPMKRAAA